MANKTMKVQATKAMAQEIAKYLKQNGVKYFVDYATLTTQQYKWYVDIDIYNHEDDYLPATGKMRVIVVEYPAEYYAAQRYITTKDLREALRYSDKTFDGFMAEVYNQIQI